MLNEYEAPEGYYYTNKEQKIFFEGLCICKNDNIENYKLITIEEANEIIKEIEAAEAAAVEI